MPGGVIKIKFHSSKHSSTQSITHRIHMWSRSVLYVVITEIVRPHLQKAPPVEREVLMPNKPRYSGRSSYMVNCTGWLLHLREKGHAPQRCHLLSNNWRPQLDMTHFMLHNRASGSTERLFDPGVKAKMLHPKLKKKSLWCCQWWLR